MQLLIFETCSNLKLSFFRMLRWNTKFKRIYFIWSDRIPYRKICPNAKTTFSSKIFRKKIKYTQAKCEPHFDFTSAHCIVTFSNEFPVNSSKMFHMKRYNTTHPLPWINFEYVKLYKRYIEEAERKEIAKRLLQLRWVRAWVMEAWVQCQLLRAFTYAYFKITFIFFQRLRRVQI